MNHGRLGSSVWDSFRESEEMPAVLAGAAKRMIAADLERAMKAKEISKADLARRMKTSLDAVRRLLDPDDLSATLFTIATACDVLGLGFVVKLDSEEQRQTLPSRFAIDE